MGCCLFGVRGHSASMVRSPTAHSVPGCHRFSNCDYVHENLRTILLDSKNHVIKVQTVYIGSLNSASVRVGELFRESIRANSAAMIVAHNHPSGDPMPSPEDVHVTRQIVEAGKLLDIDVLDHLVIGQQRWVSLKERGLGF